MKNTVKKIFKYISTALLVLIVVCTCLLLAVKFLGETPSVFGYNFYYIATGSMEPTIAVGDIILSKSADTAELKVGDVVTFNGESGELAGKIVTHRIKEIYEENGQTYVITRGDANTADDPAHRAEAVVSVMKAKLPFLGAVVRVINTPLGFIALIVIPLLISLVREIIELVQTFRSTKEELGNDELDEEIGH